MPATKGKPRTTTATKPAPASEVPRRTEARKPDHLDKAIGERLKEARKLKALSQEQLAAKVGLAFQQVQKYESGANRVSASRLYELAEALDLPVGFFFDPLRQRGLQEDPPPAFTPPSYSGDREELELMKHYRRIKDESVRAQVRDFARTLAEKLYPETSKKS